MCACSEGVRFVRPEVSLFLASVFIIRQSLSPCSASFSRCSPCRTLRCSSHAEPVLFAQRTNSKLPQQKLGSFKKESWRAALQVQIYTLLLSSVQKLPLTGYFVTVTCSCFGKIHFRHSEATYEGPELLLCQIFKELKYNKKLYTSIHKPPEGDLFVYKILEGSWPLYLKWHSLFPSVRWIKQPQRGITLIKN